MKSLCPDNVPSLFKECIDCEFMRIACAGPRTTAMTLCEWIAWIKAVMERFNISNRMVAANTPLSKSTVDDILSGRRKDISRETGCIIENYVLGNDKQPCAMHLSEDKDVVYQDRPDTLEALRKMAEELADTEQQLVAAKTAHKDEAEEYKELVRHLYTQLDRKDDYIDRLAKKAGI